MDYVLRVLKEDKNNCFIVFDFFLKFSKDMNDIHFTELKDIMASKDYNDYMLVGDFKSKQFGEYRHFWLDEIDKIYNIVTDRISLSQEKTNINIQENTDLTNKLLPVIKNSKAVIDLHIRNCAFNYMKFYNMLRTAPLQSLYISEDPRGTQGTIETSFSHLLNDKHIVPFGNALLSNKTLEFLSLAFDLRFISDIDKVLRLYNGMKTAILKIENMDESRIEIIKYIIEKEDCPITELILSFGEDSDYELDEKQFIILCDALKYNHSIDTFYIHKIRLTTACLEKIAELLKENCFLKDVFLASERHADVDIHTGLSKIVKNITEYNHVITTLDFFCLVEETNKDHELLKNVLNRNNNDMAEEFKRESLFWSLAEMNWTIFQH